MPKVSRKNLNGGFVGILALLIGVVILILLVMKSITSITSLKTGDSDNTGAPGTGIAPINAAKNAKNLIEQDNARTMQQLK